MAAIKFSKQSIQPNPMEVDYWVDITSNPYGGNIKYFNGYDWVDLLNAKGKPVNLDAYYNKLQMNQMLAGKASVESVNSKVDDAEVADVIKNIEFKDRGDEGVEMVVLKYDGMTVGVTLPTASNTTSGIITNKSFKDLVKQNQLQGVYSEMYDKLSEIRQQYQRKLKAGKNIQIDENNTIHAVGEISLDWNDVYNKPDFDKLFATVALAIQSESNRAKAAEQQLSARITDHVDVVEGKLDLKADASSVYTKDQIDEKISGIYKIKGSRTFQDLPTSGNSIGDVYNITNNFALDGVEYPLGTNVVYTATGWDALAGIFDSTEIENKVDEIDTELVEEIIRAKEKELELDKKFDDYLPLSGGTVGNGNVHDPLKIKGTTNSLIAFTGSTGTRWFGYHNDYGFITTNNGWTEAYKIITSENYSDYALPLSGGTVTGRTSFYTKDSTPVIVSSNSTNAAIAFKNSNTVDYAYLYYGPEGFIVTDDGWHNTYKIYHEGNFNPSDYLPLTGGTIEGDYRSFTIKRNAPYSSSILYKNTVGQLGSIGVSIDKHPIFIDTSDVSYKIWHQGNDGEGSGLDADKLDGKDAAGFAFCDQYPTTSDNNYNIPTGIYRTPLNTEGLPISSRGNTVIHGNFDQNAATQLFMQFNKDAVYFRRKIENSWLPWKTIAFTDYNGFYDLYGGITLIASEYKIIDLNDYKTPGTFNVKHSSSVPYVQNMPVAKAGLLSVMQPTHTEGYLIQQYNPYNSNEKYLRYIDPNTSWSEWKLISTDLSTYNAATATKATQDSEGNVITDTYALKSDVIIGLNITDGVYAVKTDGSLCTIDEADTSCTGVALIAGEHKFMIAKHNATDGTNSSLYWGKNLYKKDVAGITNYNTIDGTHTHGYLDGSSSWLNLDYTTWTVGALSDFNGKANTAAIIEAYTQYGVTMDTRDMCYSLNEFNASDEYNDWYIPACGQLALILLYRVDVHKTFNKIGGTSPISDDWYYYSSSEFDSEYSWYISPIYIHVDYNNGRKDYNHRVRFIRDLQIEPPKSVKESITEIKDQLKQPAESALKLATPVKLWGQSFDGSKGISEYAAPTMERINFSTVTGINEYDGWVGRIGDAADILLCTAGWNYLFLKTNALPRLTITPNGNVGIGTTDPLYKLSVKGNVGINDGELILDNGKAIQFKTSNDALLNALTVNTYGSLRIGFGSADKNTPTILEGGRIDFRYGLNHTLGMTLAPSGNFGIDVDDPQYKLDVNGSINLALGNAVRAGNKSLIYASNINNAVWYGLDAEGDGITYYCGNKIILKTSGNNVMVVNEHGNVTIGNSDLASTHDKLYVDGKVTTRELYVSRNIVTGLGRDGLMISDNQVNVHNNLYNRVATVFDCDLNGNAYFKHTIGGGDLVDWYGVSWSEGSSDPTCTRIGNMALHRSLPILNAMKGYVITIPSKTDVEVILPMADAFNETEYDYVDNNTHAIVGYTSTSNIMIKIPEFWYIDDYEPSTKTHNLKISQTAKAGWCHHKEAYVGAYEGYNDGEHYRSKKSVYPATSLSRTTLRELARANGYEDEYKWNIYTYEEHRAICHLFLVEYATRNSQAAVNTELTADGFKQGGLGPGCTTGAVTINGQTIYSFIPTGTTDSLGNGSGQVAYTVTQTDADGNEIGTVTRYANRYRGIENPFGHIWKHVDDIVNVYNAETTYKTVYKCNKPEHFATNKNAKYKPLCAFPGGSKMQGWSKEIKATINCDFFKYSVGGSESTYWCDYNYDNDDTTEHCLLIGGHSGSSSKAGLFNFYLGSGVGDSAVSVGSRLTYLPWAE